MPGAVLLIPFFLIRFGLMLFLNPQAMKRGAHFPPMEKGERIAYPFYQLSNIAIFGYMIFFATITKTAPWLFYAGAAASIAGLVLLAVTVANFAAPSQSGVNMNGLYRVSRNPMYLAYFVFFWGSAALTRSLMLLAFVLVFQVSTHWMILSEERWCIHTFGAEYKDYMKRVRRYL